MIKDYKKYEKKIRKQNELIYKKQQKEIEKLYIDIDKYLNNKLEKYNNDTFTDRDLEKLKKDLKNEVKQNRNKISNIIDNNLRLIIVASALIHNKFFSNIDKKYNTNLAKTYKEKTKRVEKEVKTKIKKGEVYRDNYKLSKRIWADNKKTLSDIDKIINTGIKNKLDPYTIAKDLEKYVNPSVKKDWSWSNVYPGSNKKVDYNAQRLARTSLTHAHQLSMQAYAMKNPFIEYLEYNSAHSARTCEMCADRDGQIYKKDDVPLDHPNGNCYMTVYIPEGIEDMIAQYANDEMLDDILDYL